MNFKLIPVLLCILMLSSHSVFLTDVIAADEISQEKLDAIRELMQVTGAQANRDEFSAAFSQQMLTILRQTNPELSDEAVRVVTEEVTVMVNKELDEESLQRMIYPIYARYLTLEELNGLIEFNKSAVGKKANQVMSNLMQESLEAAQIWAQTVGPKISTKVAARLKEEGISLSATNKE